MRKGSFVLARGHLMDLVLYFLIVSLSEWLVGLLNLDFEIQPLIDFQLEIQVGTHILQTDIFP